MPSVGRPVQDLFAHCVEVSNSVMVCSDYLKLSSTQKLWSNGISGYKGGYQGGHTIQLVSHAKLFGQQMSFEIET